MFESHSHDICIEKALSRAETICTNKGLRLTQLRKKVLELVWQSHGPAKAYDILDQLAHKEGNAKPPTVYRSLDFLTQNGLVHKLNSLNAYIGCSHPNEIHACYFLICDQCSEVKECCNSQLDDAIKHTAANSNFVSSQVVVEIKGLCEHCRH